MNAPPLIYLSGSDLRQALPMPDAIESMREAFSQLHAGQVTMPARGHMELTDQHGTLLMMPCQGSQTGRLTVKLVSLFSENPARGLPMLHALLVLADAETGVPLAIMDGAVLTAIRTGAASGLATQQLAIEQATTVALFGAGVQANCQLDAVCAVRPIREVRVYDIRAAEAERFVEQVRENRSLVVRRAASPAEALRGTHVVCTVTTATTPIFRDEELSPGTHINAVGSYKPEVVEIPAETVRRAHVVVDQRDAALEEAGDLLCAMASGIITAGHIRGELGELLIGDATGRSDDQQITLFKSVGLAVQDLYAAIRAAENARRMGLGIELPR